MWKFRGICLRAIIMMILILYALFTCTLHNAHIPYIRRILLVPIKVFITLHPITVAPFNFFYWFTAMIRSSIYKFHNPQCAIAHWFLSPCISPHTTRIYSSAVCVSTNLADFSARTRIEYAASAQRPAAILKRVLSLAVETADERAERENTGSTGIDRIRSPYYHRLNISRR